MTAGARRRARARRPRPAGGGARGRDRRADRPVRARRSGWSRGVRSGVHRGTGSARATRCSLYTDGVTERRRGVEQFGAERLLAMAAAAAGRPATQVVGGRARRRRALLGRSAATTTWRCWRCARCREVRRGARRCSPSGDHHRPSRTSRPGRSSAGRDRAVDQRAGTPSRGRTGLINAPGPATASDPVPGPHPVITTGRRPAGPAPRQAPASPGRPHGPDGPLRPLAATAWARRCRILRPAPRPHREEEHWTSRTASATCSGTAPGRRCCSCSSA